MRNPPTNPEAPFVSIAASHTLLFDGFVFRDSAVTQGSYHGGAIYVAGGLNDGTAVRNCVFLNNKTTGEGGGLWLRGRSATSRNLVFLNNQAATGGGAHIYGDNTTHMIEDSLFAGNVATGHSGGLYVQSYTMNLTRVDFIGNQATLDGGGVGTYNGSGNGNNVTLNATRCRFINNTARSGAALGNTHYKGPTITLENCLVASNTATHASGYVVLSIGVDSGGDITFRHTTLADNTAGGGALYSDRSHSTLQGVLSVRNSVIVGNGTGIGMRGDPHSTPTINYNNVYNFATPYSGSASAGANDISVVPGFVGSDDYRLAKASPCIDTGINIGVATDLDGVSRPTRLGYEMGAYEEWQIPIIANRAAIADATSAVVRAEFTYESADLATDAWFVLDTSDKGTDDIEDWWTSANSGEQVQGVIFGHTFAGLDPDTTYVYRCVSSNSHDVFWGPAASFKTPSAGGATRLWTGLGGNALASNTNNWQDGLAPGAGDYVLLDSSPSNMTWDAGVGGLPDTVALWTQTEKYTGTVTFNTVYGSSGFTNFTITGDAVLSKGRWTHVKNTTAETRRLRVTVGGDLTIGNTATITADDLGYNYGYGPGYLAGCGGAHGGATARQRQEDYDGIFNLKTYGSVTAPVNIGSGGAGNAAGFSGGAGAIQLTVQGTTTLPAGGVITAGGGHGGGGASGGSGGSVYLTTGWLSGGGTIRANGGGSTWNYPAGGSGGRIAVILTGAGADFSSWSGLTTAYSPQQGSGNSTTTATYPAAAGTVYLRTAAGVDTLVIDNNNVSTVAGRVPTLMPGGANAVNLNAISHVVILNKGVLGVRSDTALDFNTFAPTTAGAANSAIVLHGDAGVTYPADWTIDGYTLYPGAIAAGKLTNVTVGATGALSHPQNFRAETYKLDLALAGNLTIIGGGSITADARGYRYQGPGYLSSTYGAAHGGTATTDANNGGSANVNRKTFGVITSPVHLGSSGGDVNLSGGGAILLEVAGTTTVTSPGMITANGEVSNHAPSGGSIRLRTGYLSGNGTLRANGGNTTWDKGTAGGGGRVGVILTGSGADFSSWSGSMLAYGGVATWVSVLHAAAGTVYRQTAAQPAGAGTVVVNNSTTARNTTFTSLPAFAASAEDIRQTAWETANNARIGLVTNAAVESLKLTANGRLELAGWTLNLHALTVTNVVYKNGTYTPAEINLLTDGMGGGKVVVFKPVAGTLIVIR